MKKCIIVVFLICADFMLGQEVLKFKLEVTNEVSTPQAIDLSGVLYNLTGTYLALFQEKNGGEEEIAVQVEQGHAARLWFILEGKKKKKDIRSYVVRLVEKKASKKPVVALHQDATDLCLKQNNKAILKYRTAITHPPDTASKGFYKNLHNMTKYGAYIHPLWSPGGEVLTEKQAFDHPHHFGLWGPSTKTHIGDREVNFWDLGLGLGTVKFAGFASQSEGDVYGGFAALQHHVDFGSNGQDNIAINELLDVRAWNIGEGVWMLDYTTTLSTDLETGVLFDQYRYGSGIGFRTTDKWKDDTSTVLSSEGKTRENVDGSTGRWCIMEGISDVKEGRSGVLFMSHPSNQSFPEPLRVWPKSDHGSFLNFTPIKHKEWKLEPYSPRTQKYRLIVFDGAMTPDEAENYWQAFAHSNAVIKR